VAPSPTAALVGGLALCLSKACVDYSTSGLENPLTHLLLAAFLALYLHQPPSPRRAFWLALLAALTMLNRLDVGLLCLPALAYALGERITRPALAAVLAGGTPFALWEAFSLFYYGSLFPNTALAKLNLGLIRRSDLARQGFAYLLNSLSLDPLTLALIGLAFLVPLARRQRRLWLPALGLPLYLAYVVSIGGDFMSGRFLSAPFVWALGILLVGWHTPTARAYRWAILAAGLLAGGLLAPASPVLTAPDARAAFDSSGWATHHGISDESANYYRSTGLLTALHKRGLPDHDWAQEGREARLQGPAVIERGSVGFFGYFAGPQVHVVDLLALADPLLARLPPADLAWRIGHFGRTVPDGYLETLESGQNRIRDPNLARYYDKLALVIRGGLFDPQRLVEVWRLNTGAYDRYLEAYAYRRGTTLRLELVARNPSDQPYVYAYVWNNGSAEVVLLDDASARGRAYAIGWEIGAADVRFVGPMLAQSAESGPLSDRETLNVGVYFNPQPGSPSGAMDERRYVFRLRRSGQIEMILPGSEWHNPNTAQGIWLPQDIDAVLSETPAP